jgi:hypothetical protein
MWAAGEWKWICRCRCGREHLRPHGRIAQHPVPQDEDARNYRGRHLSDTRHLGLNTLAKKLGVLDLARMVGHRDLRIPQIDYNESAVDMASRLG